MLLQDFHSGLVQNQSPRKQKPIDIWGLLGMVPGHKGLQASFWIAWPSQMDPPLRGAGLVQLRVLFWKPFPQRLLHTDHSVHVDQPPFTTRAKKKQQEPKVSMDKL